MYEVYSNKVLVCTVYTTLEDAIKIAKFVGEMNASFPTVWEDNLRVWSY